MAEEEEDLEDEESILDLNALRNLNQRSDLDHTKPDDILESNTDAEEWKLEVERVLPSLKVHIRTDNKDWRSHLEQVYVFTSAMHIYFALKFDSIFVLCF